MKKRIPPIRAAVAAFISAGAETSARPPVEEPFAGPAGCRQCHERFYELWAPSHHGLATQPYAAEFARSHLAARQESTKIGPHEYVACLGVGAGWVLERGPGGDKRLPIVRVMGGKNVYYVLTPMGRGRLQTLPGAYDVRRREWFDTAASGARHFPGPVRDAPVHGTDPTYTFNTSGYSCHVSQLSTNYDPKTDTYHTTWAEPAFRRTLEIDPDSAIAAYNLGVMPASDRPFESLRWCRKAHELQPDEGKYGYTCAFYLHQRRETDEAVEVLKGMVRRNVPYADAYVFLGTIYLESGQWNQAAEAYQSAVGKARLAKEEREGFRTILRGAAGIQWRIPATSGERYGPSRACRRDTGREFGALRPPAGRIVSMGRRPGRAGIAPPAQHHHAAGPKGVNSRRAVAEALCRGADLPGANPTRAVRTATIFRPHPSCADRSRGSERPRR